MDSDNRKISFHYNFKYDMFSNLKKIEKIEFKFYKVKGKIGSKVKIYRMPILPKKKTAF